QDGSEASAFYLQYSHVDNRWAFARVKSDTAEAAGVRALSSSAPVLDRWTHLVGVFDGASGQLRLYVDGTLEGTATDATPYDTSGALAIGRGQFDGKASDWFSGDISDVEVFDAALSTSDVQAL